MCIYLPFKRSLIILPGTGLNAGAKGSGTLSGAGGGEA